jgi:hypothetical protein
MRLANNRCCCFGTGRERATLEGNTKLLLQETVCYQYKHVKQALLDECISLAE